MLLEGGGGSIVTSNIPSSAVAANVLSGCEHGYDLLYPRSPTTVEAMASSTSMDNSTSNIAVSASLTPKDNNVANAITTKVGYEKSTSSILSGQENFVAGCSTVTACSSSEEPSKSTETSGSGVTTADTEPGFPAIGSPPADLMVVNTNGFNPLQHAALRGNPG